MAAESAWQITQVDHDPALDFAVGVLRNSLQAVDAGPLTISIRIQPAGAAESAKAEQSYTIAAHGEQLEVVGGGRAGAMYGVLALAEHLEIGGQIDAIQASVKTPHLFKRGLKFNLPLDARTPSFSDDGDSARVNIAEMWSLDFWRELLDRMARERYNTLSLWNLHPFPSLVRVPEYPKIALDDVMMPTELPGAHTTGTNMFNPRVAQTMIKIKDLLIDDKINFWREVMSYAHDRCIEVLLFTWNVFAFGTEGNTYGIDDSMDNPITKDYFRASVRALFTTYPLLSGIGITTGENMQRGTNSAAVNERWLRETYGAAIKDLQATDPGRQLRVIHRSHWADLDTITNEFADVGVPLEFSYKYSSGHLHTSPRPHYVREEAFFEGLPEGALAWFTIRDDDYYLLRSGDPDFAREYFQAMPHQDRLHGYYLGPDGYIIGREFLTRAKTQPRQLVFDRQWYFFAIYGQLGFDPDLQSDYFLRRIAHRYRGVDAHGLYRAWLAASKIIPLVNRFHWGGNRFDLHWYPEACTSHPVQCRGFHSVQAFIDCEPIPESDLIGIPGYCAALRAGRPIIGVTPIEVAAELDGYANTALAGIAPISGAAAGELRSVVDDLAALAFLGRYYSRKISGALALHWAQIGPTSERAQRQAGSVTHLEAASNAWRHYADLVHGQYVPQRLTRLGGLTIDLHALQADVDHDIEIAAAFTSDHRRDRDPTQRRAAIRDRPLPYPRRSHTIG